MFGTNESTSIAIGTVGWDDKDTHFEKGTGDNEGYTLIFVQLFNGRDFTKKLDPTKGQGHKILCHLSSSLFRIPPKGTRVYVAFPTGQDTAIGSGVIFATVEKSPTIQFESDRVVMDYGANTHVVIRGKSVSISDPSNRFITVGTPRIGGTPGIIFQDEDGTGGLISDGMVSWFAADENGAGTALLRITDGELLGVTKGAADSYLKLTTNFEVLSKNGFLSCGTIVLGGGPGTYLPVIAAPAIPSLSVLIKTA